MGSSFEVVLWASSLRVGSELEVCGRTIHSHHRLKTPQHVRYGMSGMVPGIVGSYVRGCPARGSLSLLALVVRWSSVQGSLNMVEAIVYVLFKCLEAFASRTDDEQRERIWIDMDHSFTGGFNTTQGYATYGYCSRLLDCRLNLASPKSVLLPS